MRAQPAGTRPLFVPSYVSLSGRAFAQAFDKAEFAARRAKLFEQMADGVAVVFADEQHVHAVKFRQSPDFFYLTGVEEPGAVLLLDGKTKQAILYAHKRPDWKVNVEGPGILNEENPPSVRVPVMTSKTSSACSLTLSLRRAQALRPLFRDRPAPARARERGTRDGALDPPLSANPLVKQAVARLNGAPQMIDKTSTQCSTNSAGQSLRKSGCAGSGRIGAEGVKAAMRGTKPGMFEYEVEAAARFVYVKSGARGDAFTPIVASGPNTTTWHYQRNDRQMQAGDVVLMDYGADFDYYTSDITRTWPVSGTFTEEQLKMYRCILDARDAIIAAMKPGVTSSSAGRGRTVYTKHGSARSSRTRPLYRPPRRPLRPRRGRRRPRPSRSSPVSSSTSSRFWNSATARFTCASKTASSSPPRARRTSRRPSPPTLRPSTRSSSRRSGRRVALRLWNAPRIASFFVV